MIRGLVIREFEDGDADGVRAIVEAAFGNPAEARLVEMLREAGDDVLELVAAHEEEIVGHVFFSRLQVDSKHRSFDAVALAPLAVQPMRQRTGVGIALVENAHRVLRQAGEILSVVLGDPAYYGRFGYAHDRAAKFESAYQGPSLQALSFAPEAPTRGTLVYAPAFSQL